MSSNGATQELSSEQFKTDFSLVQPLILKEWSSLDASALSQTNGDLDKVVDLIADKTASAKTVVRQQLSDMRQTALRSQGTPARADARVRQMIERLEKRTAELAKELRGNVLNNAKEKVRQNVLMSLLAALGLGFLIGIVVGLIGGNNRGK